MSFIHGVLLAGGFRSSRDLMTMSSEDQRNTLITELTNRSNQSVSHFQGLDDAALAGAGAVLVFLREAKIRTDAQLKTISDDDMRNILIVETAAFTAQSGPALQAQPNLKLVATALGGRAPDLQQPTFIRGVLLAGQFRSNVELSRMSAEDQRNTLITELTNRSSQPVGHFQGMNDFVLAGAGAVMVVLRAAKSRTDGQLKTLGDDDWRNILIVETAAFTHLSGPDLQRLSNIDLVSVALGGPLPPPVVILPPIQAPEPALPDTMEFDAGPLTTTDSLPLNGSAHLVMTRAGDFTFSSSAHDSGADNIDYTVSAVLVSTSGIAFTFQHDGSTEGTTAGLPFGTPRRDDHFATSGSNLMITREWTSIATTHADGLHGSIRGTDTLVGGLEKEIGDVLKSALQEAGKAAAQAVVALVAA